MMMVMMAGGDDDDGGDDDHVIMMIGVMGCMQNHGSDAYSVCKAGFSLNSRLKLHMRQTITEDTQGL